MKKIKLKDINDLDNLKYGDLIFWEKGEHGWDDTNMFGILIGRTNNGGPIYFFFKKPKYGLNNIQRILRDKYFKPTCMFKIEP